MGSNKDKDAEAHVKLVERIYGFDWIGVGSRQKGFSELSDLVTEDFESQISPELGGRTVDLEGLRVMIDGLEQDFAEFHYNADEIVPASDGKVVAAGRIQCRGRASGMPLSNRFGHVWTLAGGKARSVIAYMDRDEAMKAAGLKP